MCGVSSFVDADFQHSSLLSNPFPPPFLLYTLIHSLPLPIVSFPYRSPSSYPPPNSPLCPFPWPLYNNSHHYATLQLYFLPLRHLFPSFSQSMFFLARSTSLYLAFSFYPSSTLLYTILLCYSLTTLFSSKPNVPSLAQFTSLYPLSPSYPPPHYSLQLLPLLLTSFEVI